MARIDFSYSRQTTQEVIDQINKCSEISSVSIHHCPHVRASEVMAALARRGCRNVYLDADTNFSLFCDVDAACEVMSAGVCTVLKIGQSMGLVSFRGEYVDKQHERLSRLLRCVAALPNCVVVRHDRILPNEYRYGGAFKPKNENEEATKQRLVDLMESQSDAFSFGPGFLPRRSWSMRARSGVNATGS